MKNSPFDPFDSFKNLPIRYKLSIVPIVLVYIIFAVFTFTPMALYFLRENEYWIFAEGAIHPMTMTATSILLAEKSSISISRILGRHDISMLEFYEGDYEVIDDENDPSNDADTIPAELAADKYYRSYKLQCLLLGAFAAVTAVVYCAAMTNVLLHAFLGICFIDIDFCLPLASCLIISFVAFLAAHVGFYWMIGREEYKYYHNL